MSEFKWLKPPSKVYSDVGFNRLSSLVIANSCARYMNEFVPMQTGVLSQNYETGADAIGGYVRYNSPYAHYQYSGEGFDFSKEQHPLATHHWDQAMMLAKGVQYIAEVNRIRKGFSK